MKDIFENYKPPITVYSDFANQIMQEQENKIMCKIKTVVDVDKYELIKALNYDRNQYEAGYKAGVQQMQKHGHFVQNEFISKLGICSECEHPIEDGDKFCKWCGAQMDEVTE